MRTGDWALSAAGALLALAVLLDVFLTVLHMRRDGPVAHALVRGVWHSTRFLGRRFPRLRPVLTPLAGPLALAGIFGAWISMFILAFAILYWPHLDLFRSASRLGDLGFPAAVYYSGNVSTVLGFGDITPLSTGLRMLTLTQAVLGFGIVTAAVTYLISVIGSAGQRNALSQKLWLTSGETSDGLQALLAQLSCEEIPDVHARYLALTSDLYVVEEQLRRLPVIDLLYRSGSPEHAPETMIRAAASLALSGAMVAAGPGGKRLGPISRDLGAIVTRMMRNGTSAWFGQEALERFDRADPTRGDLERLYGIRDLLVRRLSHLGIPNGYEPAQEIVILQSRLRIFLDEVREKMV